MTITLQNLLKNSVRFGHFQFYAVLAAQGSLMSRPGCDNLNQSLILSDIVRT